MLFYYFTGWSVGQLKNYGVCHQHIKEEDVEQKSGRRSLLPDAIPSLNLPTEEQEKEYLSTLPVEKPETGEYFIYLFIYFTICSNIMQRIKIARYEYVFQKHIVQAI